MTVPQRHPTGPAIGYLRVSKEEQARGDRTSLPHQRARLAQLADALGLTLAQVFEDPGVSGGTAEDRPGFQALLRYCLAHPQPRRSPGLVLVYNDSRWGRFADPEEATYWRVHLSKHAGWTVRFTEGDDTADPLARGILRSLYSSQASAYRDQVRQNATQGARGTAAQGYWQNEAPLGYRRQATSATGATRVLQPGQRKADDERVRLTALAGLVGIAGNRTDIGQQAVTQLNQLESNLKYYQQRRRTIQNELDSMPY
jgi:DNA invertase Pin-like site-specific DNA recombinase